MRIIDGKRAWGLSWILNFNETINHLAMAGSVFWYGDVLMREDGEELRREGGGVSGQGSFMLMGSGRELDHGGGIEEVG